MPTQAASTARPTERPPQPEFRWRRLLSWFQRRKESFLLELLNLLEPRRPSHQ